MSVDLGPVLEDRRDFSRLRLDAIRASLTKRGAGEILGASGLVYATGSMARGDASSHSDLDAFILSHESDGKRALTNLDSIRLKSALIDVVRGERLPDFSDDGKYLTVHTVDEMLTKLGTAEDDYENLFTARMLLLLESVPLLGDDAYHGVLQRVVDKYWTDYQGNESDFLPVFLTNDIVRYWKVLCLNYEAFTSTDAAPKRRHQNYKLKFSRLLTCYSAIVYLLALVRTNGRTRPEDGMILASKSPLERLLWAAETLDDRDVDTQVSRMFEMYVSFLNRTDAPKEEVRNRFEDDDYNAARRKEAKAFGEDMFNLMQRVGGKTPLYRYLVV
jgi:hypothetical protein